MIVVDASVLVPALSDDGRDGDVARARLLAEALSAPELIDLEVTSVLRRLVRAGAMPAARAELALRAPRRLSAAAGLALGAAASVLDAV